MTPHPSATPSPPAMVPFGRPGLRWLLLMFLLFAPQLVFGTDDEWTGSTNTDWSTKTNWNPGLPKGSDNAKFDSTFVNGNQPNLSASTSVGGLWMATGVEQNVTISGGPNVLTLNGNTISLTPGLGILIDNTTAFTLTISAPLLVGAAQTWRNNSSNLFTVSGTVNTNGF